MDGVLPEIRGLLSSIFRFHSLKAMGGVLPENCAVSCLPPAGFAFSEQPGLMLLIQSAPAIIAHISCLITQYLPRPKAFLHAFLRTRQISMI